MAWLLFSSFLFFQSVSLFAQSTLFLVSPNWKQADLTHTVFRGSSQHYDMAPFNAGKNGISDDLLSPVGSREHGLATWKYKIVATVFWVGEQAVEGNPVPGWMCATGSLLAFTKCQAGLGGYMATTIL